MSGSVQHALREPAEPLEPVVDPAAWSKEDLARANGWLYPLSEREIADLDRVVADLEARGVALIDVRRDDVPMPVLGPVLERLQAELLDGRGFVLMRGVPVHRYTRLQSAIAFWAIGAYVGVPVSQNAHGHLLGHVIDLATDPDDPAERGYYTAKKLSFHVDGVVDIVGLLCLQRAKSGGESAVVSSVSVYNEMLKRRPEFVAALREPIYRDRHDEIPEGALPYYQLPVFSFQDGYLSTGYGNIRSALRFPDVPRHSAELTGALEMFDAVATELCFTMEFQQGDVQLLNNHVIAHARTSAVVDYPEPSRKRHLLRLRMMTPGGRPMSPAYFALENLRPDHITPGQRHSGAIVAPDTVLKVPLEPTER